MKYILKKDLPLAKAGTEVELKDDWINYAIMADEMIDFVTLWYILSKDIPEWLEEVKEHKTINDLKLMAGATLPILGRNVGYISMGVEYGTKGIGSDNKLSEDLLSFNFILTFADRWFVRQKFD